MSRINTSPSRKYPATNPTHAIVREADRRLIDKNDQAVAQLEFGPGVAVEGVTINLPTLAMACAEIIRGAVRGRGFTFFTMNLDHVAQMRLSAAFRAVYRRATFVSADGWPIVWLAARQSARLERTCGSDLVEPLCAAAAARGISVYFVGPGQRAQSKGLDLLQGRYPGLRIAGAETPQFATEMDPGEIDALATRLNASGARLCFVSLGAPKQELVADALFAQCPQIGFVCVGAALDFISGEKPRAPRWMQRGKLEWLWRLSTDPRRLAARYAGCAGIFLLMALGFRIASE